MVHADPADNKKPCARQGRGETELTGVLLDEVVDAGVLSHIRDHIAHSGVHRVGNLLVIGVERAFYAVSLAVVFNLFVAVFAVAIIEMSALVVML